MEKSEDTAELSFYYGAPNKPKQLADKLQREQTNAEYILWEILKNRRFNGYKFRRLKLVEFFSPGFYCHHLKLVIEVVGEFRKESDQESWASKRSAGLNQFKVEVISFSKELILSNPGKVVESIKSKCQMIENSIK